MVGSSDDSFYCVFGEISIRSMAYIYLESHEYFHSWKPCYSQYQLKRVTHRSHSNRAIECALTFSGYFLK